MRLKKLGATALFGEKYGDRVRVVSVGETNPISMEFCAGTHTKNTGNIGFVKIVSEGSIASGIRRISLLTGESAIKYVRSDMLLFSNVLNSLKTAKENVSEKVEKLILENRDLEVKNDELELQLYLNKLEMPELGKQNQISIILNNTNPKYIRKISSYIMEKTSAVAVCLVVRSDEKVVVAVSTNGQFNAGLLIKDLIGVVGGKGAGGTNTFAQGGGNDSLKIKDLIGKFNNLIKG